LPISDKYKPYAENIFKKLREEGYRVEIDNKVESLNKKIRQAELSKIPLMVIIGEKEQKSNTITIRKKTGSDIKNIKIEEFFDILKENTKNRKTYLN
jgi:threonyl-tRNA synthetase